MSNIINVGDYIRCINSNGLSSISDGNIYIVHSIDNECNSLDYSIFGIINDDGEQFGYYSHRFVYDVVSNRRKKLERLRGI